MSDRKHLEGDGLHDSLLPPAGHASSDVFEVVDVMVKEEPADFDVVVLEDTSSLPGPSELQPAQDDQTNMNEVTASFRCQKCGKTFRDLRRLKRHDRDVHALVRIQCEICSYSSARKDHLQRHYQCWHKERWAPNTSWWKRATQKNKARSKMLYRPEVTRRGSSGGSGNVMSRQRSSSAPRTNVQHFPSRERSTGAHVPRVASSTLSTSVTEPDLPTLWSSLPMVSSPDVSDSHDSPLTPPVSLSTSPNLTPTISASSVLSLLQPSASLSPPFATASPVSTRIEQHDPSAVASSITPISTTSTVSLLSARPTAFVGNSPQIVSLLRSASPTGSSGGSGVPSTVSGSSSSALAPPVPASSSFSSTLTTASSNSALSSLTSPRSKQRDPVVSTCTVSVLNARPTSSGGNSSQIFSLLRNTSSTRTSGAAGTGGMVPRNSPSVVKVQAQMSQNTSSSSMSQQSNGSRSTGSKWATVEEKKLTKYFVEGRLVRQEEETVQSYKKIPAHWDLGIDLRDNYPSN